MQIHPNETTVEAKVKQIVKSADGFGHEVDLEILNNTSADDNLDYIKPQTGDELKVFVADLGSVQKGAHIRATLGLSGRGQRAVLRNAESV